MNRKKEEQSYLVVKANELVQQARFDLDVQEQKIVLFLVSKIKPTDSEFKWYDLRVVDFRETLNIKSYAGGSYYDYIKSLIKKLADKSAWLKLDPNSDEETLVRWIDKARINKKKDILKVRLDEDLKPFLLQLKKHFTAYELWYVLSMKSQYSIRLYEFLKSLLHKKETYTKTFKLEYLKEKMSAEKQVKYYDFKRFGLEKAISEINQFTDLEVAYEAIFEKNRCKEIVLSVKVKDVLERAKIADSFFNGCQLDIFEQLPTDSNDWEVIYEKSDSRQGARTISDGV